MKRFAWTVLGVLALAAAPTAGAFDVHISGYSPDNPYVQPGLVLSLGVRARTEPVDGCPAGVQYDLSVQAAGGVHATLEPSGGTGTFTGPGNSYFDSRLNLSFSTETPAFQPLDVLVAANATTCIPANPVHAEASVRYEIGYVAEIRATTTSPFAHQADPGEGAFDVTVVNLGNAPTKITTSLLEAPPPEYFEVFLPDPFVVGTRAGGNESDANIEMTQVRYDKKAGGEFSFRIAFEGRAEHEDPLNTVFVTTLTLYVTERSEGAPGPPFVSVLAAGAAALGWAALGRRRTRR